MVFCPVSDRPPFGTSPLYPISSRALSICSHTCPPSSTNRPAVGHALRFSFSLHSRDRFLPMRHRDHVRRGDLVVSPFWKVCARWTNVIWKRVFTGLFKANHTRRCRVGENTDVTTTKISTYLKAPPRPWREPKPPKGDEKKSCSVSKSKTFLSKRLSPMSKNEANGLLEPKNCAKVARGSPWNWYVNVLFELVPLLLPAKGVERNTLGN